MKVRMKYDAIDTVLPRGGNTPEISTLLAEYGDALDQTVNFGTHLLSWQLDSLEQADGNADCHIPVLMLLRHALQLIDAISIMTRKSCIDASKVNVRAFFEAVLSVEYILQEDSERRGMCFMTCHFHDRIAAYETSDPNTQRGKQYRAKAARDSYAGPKFIKLIQEPPDVKDKVKGFRNVLEREEYRPFEAEYKRLRKGPKRKSGCAKSKGPPPWYSFFGGPRNIEELAGRLDHPTLYEEFYRGYSAVTHGTGTGIITGNIMHGDNKGETAIIQIRSPKDTHQVVTFSLTLSLILYRLVITKYAPGKIQDLRDWYSSEIRNVHRMGNRIVEAP